MLQKRNKVVVGQNSHSGFAFAIICAQFFFLFPVCGIWGPDYRSLKFRWNSFRCLTVYAFQIVLICYSSLTILFFSELGINLSNIGKLSLLRYNGCTLEIPVSLFFSVSATLMSILLLVLSRDWPGLMKKWAGVDRAMRTYGYPRNLNRKLKMAFGIVMVPAMSRLTSVFLGQQQTVSIIFSWTCMFGGSVFLLLSYIGKKLHGHHQWFPSACTHCRF